MTILREAQAFIAQLGREKELLQAKLDAALVELDTLRKMYTWKQPPYSAEQLESFKASAYSPPPQAIPWHFLPEVPEILPLDEQVEVRGCGFLVDAPLQKEYTVNVFYNRDGCWYNHRDYKMIIRAWHYLPTEAPPKPLGENQPIEFGEVKDGD